MSEARELPRRIVVAGDGQLGVLAAIALRQALPASEVMVIGTPPDPTALADRAATALPFTNRLHDRLGIDEEDLVRRTGASHRLVVRYLGWSGVGGVGAAPYGAAIDPALKTAFAKEWGGGPRNASTGASAGSVGEALAAAGRFAPPSGDSGSALADLDYAVRWNVLAYRDLLIAVASQIGVQHQRGAITGVVPDGAGGAEALAIAGVGEVPADLFIDCTGPGGAILSRLPAAQRIDWSAGLPVRRLLWGRPGDAALALDDRVTLTSAGWLGEIAGRDGRAPLLAMADGVSEDAALATLGAEPAGITALSPGRAADAWLGNVIALGDAAATFEPLGWLNLDLAHRQLALLLELLPGRLPDSLERAEFNRRSGLMAERARDFVAAHYAAPAAAGVFGEVLRSDELALALDQFTRRGRLPFFEEMPMLVQEWSTVLHALGIPAGDGPLAHSANPRVEEAARTAHAAKCVAAVAAAPSYPAWLGSVLEG